MSAGSFTVAVAREQAAYRAWMTIGEEDRMAEVAALKAYDRARDHLAATPIRTRADAVAAVAWLRAEVEADLDCPPVGEVMEARLPVLASLAAFLEGGRA